jgi:predicted 3-demethylubiquinone-9 3-methyltransferase (glyoxalase superfamily)
MQGIHPMLWFNGQAEEAVDFYLSIFGNSRILSVLRVPENQPEMVGKAGEVLLIDFELNGQRYSALNGGPEFKFNESVSFVVNCEDQAEVDKYWDALLAGGGQPSACGWLKDKFGVSWQVTPTVIEQLYRGEPKKVEATFAAMMKMVKLDVAELERAYNAA